MATMDARNLQDNFLIRLYKMNLPVIIHLSDKSQLRGRIRGFDLFTILIENDGNKQLIDRNIISAISPLTSSSVSSTVRSEMK